MIENSEARNATGCEKPDALPVVSIMIATFNSAKLLPRTLDALRKQTYPQDKLEILIIDGGSRDATESIAREYKCRFINNPKTEPVHAKMLGAAAATGEYLVTIDHDEVLLNPNSILLKVSLLLAHPECHAALCSGYLRPADYPYINEYISEFGDPYSYFIYHFSKGVGYFERTLRRSYFISDENADSFIVSVPPTGRQPIFELVCLGTMIELDYFRSICDFTNNPADLTHMFYIMRGRGEASLVFINNDPVEHYSADSLKAYWPKLKWRVCNNVHFTEKGEASFSGRQRYQPALRLKKYFFIPYALTIVIPLCEGVVMALERRNPIFLLHPVLCFYVAVQILWQFLRKLLGLTPELKSYDGKKSIER